MKKTLMISMAILFAVTAFGQGKYLTTNNIKLYSKPDLIYSNLTKVSTGNYLELVQKTGEFWQVKYHKKLKYMPLGGIKYCASVDSMKISLMPQVGEALSNAGDLLLASSAVVIAGGAIGYILSTSPRNSETGKICIIASVFCSLCFQIFGYSELVKVGERIKVGATSSGMGMTINLNK